MHVELSFRYGVGLPHGCPIGLASPFCLVLSCGVLCHTIECSDATSFQCNVPVYCALLSVLADVLASLSLRP